MIYDHYRTQKRDVPLEDQDVPEEDSGKGHLQASAALWLDELIRQLPPQYEEAVRLSEISGLPQQDIADRLGLSLSGRSPGFSAVVHSWVSNSINVAPSSLIAGAT